jgi:hypothetical protein
VTIDWEQTPEDDGPTFDMLSRGDTFGVFQLEASGISGFTKGYKPRSIDDISIISALYRPGPLDNGMVDAILSVRKGKKIEESPVDVIKEILKDTNGVLTYQEQVLAISREMAGFTLSGADLLRRAIGKKLPEEMQAQEQNFVDGSVEKGYPKHQALEVFEIIKKFADYCLSYDTKVLTDKGPLSIGHIVENQLEVSVYSIDEHGLVYSQPVAQWHDRGIREVFEYKLEDGSVIRATEDHKFMTVDGDMLAIETIFLQNRDMLVIETGKIQIGEIEMKPYNKLNDLDKQLVQRLYYEGLSFEDISKEAVVSQRSVSRVLQEANINTRRKNRYTLNESFFCGAYDHYECAYFLGLLAADGCVTHKDYIALQLIDEELVLWFRKAIEYSGEVRLILGEERKPPGQDAYRVNFSSAIMSEELRSYGIIAGRHLQAIPKLEDSIVPHFIRGYFDGDGCVYLRPEGSGGVVHIVASEAFCESLKEYFGFGTISSHPSGMYYWRIFAKKHVNVFYEALYDSDGSETLCLNRKKQLMEAFLRSYKYENCWKAKD